MPFASNRCTFRDEEVVVKRGKISEDSVFDVVEHTFFSLQNFEAINKVKLILLFLKVLLMLIFFLKFTCSVFIWSVNFFISYNNMYKWNPQVI